MRSLIFILQAATAFAASPFAGVNIAGFDFGSDIQGKQNISNSFGPVAALGNGNSDGIAQIQHFVQQDGLNTFRLPVTWQFLINSNNLNGTAVTDISPGALATSNGQLDQVNMGQYDQLVRGCLATGSFCIVDIHNYARFEGQIIGQGGPTNQQFANLWSQIATMYRNESKVIFGIMNEPHDIPNISIWADTVQAAVTAIRMAGATTQMILLPGNDFTGAQTYVSNGSFGNLSRVHNLDGSNTSLIFDVHKYLDSDGSGTQLECVSSHVNDTFMPLSRVLVANGRKAILSETGGGNTTSCLADLCGELAFINANPNAFLGYTAWAAGGFSATDYNLTMTPFGSAGNFQDQETVRQCVVGTRTGLNSSALLTSPMNSGMSSTSATSPSTASTASTPLTPASGGSGQVLTAGSHTLRVGAALSLVGLATALLML